MIKVGPSYSTYGSTVWDDRGKSEVVQILISHGQFVNSIQFLYADNGDSFLSSIRGEMSHRMFDVVDLDYPSEFITRVSGDYGTRGTSGPRFLATITIGTNKATYGPYGKFGDDSYKFDYQLGTRRSFGGFHGTVNGNLLNSIGLYIKQIPLPDVPNKTKIPSLQESNKDKSGD